MGLIVLALLFYFIFYLPFKDKESFSVEVSDISEIVGLPENYYKDFKKDSLTSDLTIVFFGKTKIIINKNKDANWASFFYEKGKCACNWKWNLGGLLWKNF